MRRMHLDRATALGIGPQIAIAAAWEYERMDSAIRLDNREAHLYIARNIRRRSNNRPHFCIKGHMSLGSH